MSSEPKPIGRMFRALKDHRATGIHKDNWLVVVSFTPARPARTGSVTGKPKLELFKATTKAYALAVQRVTVKGSDSTAEETMAANVAKSHCPGTVEVDGLTVLGQIHKEWKKEVMGIGLPQLTAADLPDDAPTHELVGAKRHLKFPHFPDEGDGVFVDGEVEVTGFFGGDPAEFELSFLDTDDKLHVARYPGPLVEHMFSGPTPARERPESLLEFTLPVAEYPMMRVVAAACTESRPKGGEALVVNDGVTLGKALCPAVTDKLSASPSRAERRSVALEVAKAMEASLLKCKQDNRFVSFKPPDGTATTAAVITWLRPLLRPQPITPSLDAFPRTKVLWGLALSPEAWDEFLTSAMSLFEEGERLAATIRLKGACLARLERFLRKCPAASPEVLSMEVTLMDASALFARVAEWIAESEDSSRRSSGRDECSATSWGEMAETITRQKMDTSGTPEEVAERMLLLQSAKAVEEQPSLRAFLRQCRELAQSSPGQLHEKLADAGDDVQRLLSTGEEISKALNGQVKQDLALDVTTVRSALAKQLEKRFSRHGLALPERVNKQLNLVRLGRIGKVDLHQLLDLPGEATKEAPLRSFSKDSQPVARFSEAAHKLGLAWSLAEPQHANEIMQFTVQLSSTIRDAIDKGTSWDDVSIFYKDLMRRVDHAAISYSASVSGSGAQRRSPPDVRWITDQATEYCIALNRAAGQAIARTAGQAAASAMDYASDPRFQQEVQAAVKRATQSLHQQMVDLRLNHKRSNGNGGKGNGGGGGGQGGRGDTPPGAPKAKKPKPSPTPNEPGTGKFDGRSWAAQTKHLAETVGEYDGKAPCIFYHTPGFTCTNDADPSKCKGHHHS